MQHKTAADIEVELPKSAPTVLRTDHAMHAIVKAKMPQLNRKQRRVMAARMQIHATKTRNLEKVRGVKK